MEFQVRVELDDLEERSELVGDEGVLRLREKGFLKDLKEDMRLVVSLLGVLKGEDSVVFGSARLKFSGKGGTGLFFASFEKWCISLNRSLLRVGYDFGSVPCLRREDTEEEMVDVDARR